MTAFGSLLNVLLLTVLVNGSVLTRDQEEKLVMCYFEGVSGIRSQDEVRFTPEDLDLTICTHVVYNRALVSQEMDIVPKNKEVDLFDNGGKGMYNRTVGLKNLKPELQVFIDVYDTDGEIEKQVKVVANHSALVAFARNAADFVESHGFDGMNIRLNRNSMGYDEVVPIIHEEFVRRGLKLTSFLLPPEFHTSVKFHVTEPLSRYLDFVVVGSYWRLSPEFNEIFSNSALLEKMVDSYLDLGVPPEKIVVAIPAFSVTTKLCDRADSALNSSICDGGDEGMYEPQARMILYNSELRRKMANTSEEWVVTRDEVSKVSYGHSRSLQWTSFEDSQSLRAKAEFILGRGLAGVAIMNVDMEDFKGAFTEGGETFPLARAAYNALNGVP